MVNTPQSKGVSVEPEQASSTPESTAVTSHDADLDVLARTRAAVAEPSEQSPTADDVRSRLAELRKLEHASGDLFSMLSRNPGRYGELKSLLNDLERHRSEVAMALGLSLLGFLIGGGDATFVDSDEPGAEGMTDRRSSDPDEACGETVEAPRDVATADDVRRFVERFTASRTPVPRSAASLPPVRAVMADLLDRAGSEFESRELASMLEEVERLEGVTAPPAVQAWMRLPAEMQRIWIGFLCAWVRSLQDRSSGSRAVRERADQTFPLLREFLRQHDPGYVYGLRRDDPPRSGSWAADAHALLDELREFVVGDAVEPPSAAGRGPASATDEDRQDEDCAEPEDDLEDWPHRDAVRGLQAVILGGVPKEHRRAAIQRTFGFGELDWIDPTKPRRVENLVKRVTTGTLDVVILNRYRGHVGSGAVCEAANSVGIITAVVGGYGTTEIREALARAIVARERRESCGQPGPAEVSKSAAPS